MTTTLVTGAAGFIGFHICKHLLDRGQSVIGIDNLNGYYDTQLKKDRLQQLQIKAYQPIFKFYDLNIANKDAVNNFISEYSNIDRIVHLAAQAGVRYSLINPYAYLDANLAGHLNILESCRKLPNLQHMVYASSSSVYGSNQKLPFSVNDPADHPISLYAATKRSGELMAHTYSHLYQIPMTGLRYFTVYGPWGRPDMSTFIFTKAIFSGEEIPVFNHGDMRRNFSYISDIVDGTIVCLNKPPHKPRQKSNEEDNFLLAPHKIYNLGNNESESLMTFIDLLEKATGQKAKLRFEPMQPGDIKETIADISDAKRDFGFSPKTSLKEGLQKFVDWYRSYYGISI